MYCFQRRCVHLIDMVGTCRRSSIIPGMHIIRPAHAVRHYVQEFRIIIVLRRRVIMTRIGNSELA